MGSMFADLDLARNLLSDRALAFVLSEIARVSLYFRAQPLAKQVLTIDIINPHEL